MDQNMNMGTTMPEEKKPVGTIISIIVIVLVVAFGAFYFLRQVPLPAGDDTLTATEVAGDANISALSTQGTSTDINDIQKDINSTNFSGIDAGLSGTSI